MFREVHVRQRPAFRRNMYLHPKSHVGTWTRACKPSLHPGRATLRLFGLRAIATPTSFFRPMNTMPASHHRISVLPVVHSAINLALPSGPFDDPAATHRASCNAGSTPPEEEEQLLPMFLRSTSLSSPIGFLRPKVVEEILEDHQESGKKSIWNVLRRLDDSPWAICFADHVAEFETRTHAMRVVLERWKSRGLFPDILKGMGACFHYFLMNSIQYVRLEQRDIPCVYASTGTSRSYLEPCIRDRACCTPSVWICQLWLPSHR